MQGNIFTDKMNQCIYQIDEVEKQLIQKVIFCLDEQDNDEFDDIQYQGGKYAVINSKKNIYVIKDNQINQILPKTNVYLLQNISQNENSESDKEIEDLSEKLWNISDFPIFNFNLQQYDRKLMGYRNPSSQNGQQVEYIYLVRFFYGQNIQKVIEQDISLNIYFQFQTNMVFITGVNDLDGIYQYYEYNIHSNKKNLNDSSFRNHLLYFQSIVSFIISFFFILLMFRRSKNRKEVLLKIEDFLFRQVVKLSKEQFQKKYQFDYRDSIGSGSFGQVYKIKNKYKSIIKNPDILENMPDYYACKQIHVSQDGQNQMQQIYHEIEILQKIKKYDHVIKLQNYVIEERSTYIILDLAESTLQEQINNKQSNERYSEIEIIKFLQQIGKTLAIIYTEEGIAHRDIKPSNILIKDGNYYLSDFGSAEILFETENARNNLVLGTLKWMSPELRDLKKNQAVDFFKSDIFSLGMVLLYMMTLSDISQVNYDEFSKNQKLRFLRNQNKHISQEILFLVSKMLETDPDNRPCVAILTQAILDIETNSKLSVQASEIQKKQ